MIENRFWTVYAHINKLNGKIYIGITSQKVEKRWMNGQGYIQCPKFYNAIKKYGWDGFEHEIIAEKLTEEESKKFEQTLIKKLNTQNDEYGYNLTAGGDGYYGLKHSDETKEKLRQAYYNMSPETRRKMIDATIGRKLSNNHKQHISEGCVGKGTKEVCQYSKEGIFIRKWSSLTEASKTMNIHIGDISNCCKGVCGQTGGFQWKMFNGSIENIEPYVVDMSRHVVIQKTFDGNVVRVWNSLKEIEETLGKKTGNITSVCSGKRNKAYGYKWEYAS